MRNQSQKSLKIAITLIILFSVVFGLLLTINLKIEQTSILKTPNIENTFAVLEQSLQEKPNVMPNGSNQNVKPSVLPDDLSYERSVTSGKKSVRRNLSTGKVLIEATTKRVLFGENEDVKLYPASTTKVLTALCVLNNLPLDRVIEVPKIAEGVEGSSIYLKAGQRITVEDLLFGLMLRSGNDAAVTLAVETSGSIEDFAVLMNETAKKCGAKNSNFVNPHGLQDENHYTTAYDLALITAKAYENEDFVRIVSSKLKKIKIDDSEVVIANKNKMLKTYDGSNGVKTGFTKSSGRCLISGAKRDGMQLVSVVLNCSDMWNESVRMLDFGFDNFEMTSIEDAVLLNGATKVIAHFNSSVDENWHSIKFPLRKDGSETLIVNPQ